MHTTFAEHNQTQEDPELAPFEAKVKEDNKKKIKTKMIDPISGAVLDPDKAEDLMYHDEKDVEMVKSVAQEIRELGDRLMAIQA